MNKGQMNVQNLTVQMKDKVILKDISFAVEAGETIAILGPSGSGKSTLIRTLAGLQKKTDGDILVNGQSTNEKELLKIGTLLFQNFNLFKNLKVLENVASPAWLSGQLKKEEALERASDLLDYFHLSGQKSVFPAALSGGQQRVAIARAIMSDAPILFFDEPTSALDRENWENLLNYLSESPALKERTKVFVTHEVEFAKRVANRSITIQDGRIVKDEKQG